MKIYEKPRLVALSLSGNSLICSCEIDAVGDNMAPQIRQLLDDLENFGFSTAGLFAADMTDCASNPVDAYCKFGPTGMLVFNS